MWFRLKVEFLMELHQAPFFSPPPPSLLDEMPIPVMASRVPMALGQQQHLAQAATLEHLKERLERGAAADCPEKKMLQLAEEQQRLMQQALQQNLLALASHFTPMNLKLNNGHGEPL